MKRFFQGMGIVMILLTMVGCDAFNTLSKKKAAQGRPYELIVVCPQMEWNGELGDSLRAIFTAPVPYLNQDEPLFDVLRVTERGFYLSTGNPPTAADTKIVSAATGNAITADLTGLSPNTRYYIRAYATNAQGTATGSINVFTTQDDRTAPTVGSITASNITAESVDLLATILADGGAAVTERGFCYTTNPDAAPTVADAKVVSAATGTDIAATLAGLTARTTYYIRAYATNGSRTGYSDVLRVTTSPSGVPDIGDNESPDM